MRVDSVEHIVRTTIGDGIVVDVDLDQVGVDRHPNVARSPTVTLGEFQNDAFTSLPRLDRRELHQHGARGVEVRRDKCGFEYPILATANDFDPASERRWIETCLFAKADLQLFGGDVQDVPLRK